MGRHFFVAVTLKSRERCNLILAGGQKLTVTGEVIGPMPAQTALPFLTQRPLQLGDEPRSSHGRRVGQFVWPDPDQFRQIRDAAIALALNAFFSGRRVVSFGHWQGSPPSWSQETPSMR